MKGILVAVFLMVLTTQPAVGRYLSRQKRVSDQRLAEIETLLALSKYKGLLSTVPVGFNRIDPSAVGRRRRASPLLWRDLAADSEEDIADMNDEAVDGEEVQDHVERVAAKRLTSSPSASEYKLISERRRRFGESVESWEQDREPPRNNI